MHGAMGLLQQMDMSKPPPHLVGCAGADMRITIDFARMSA